MYVSPQTVHICITSTHTAYPKQYQYLLSFEHQVGEDETQSTQIMQGK